MFALVFAILAALCFLLALVGVAVGTVNLVTLGLLFFVLSFIMDHLPARYNRSV